MTLALRPCRHAIYSAATRAAIPIPRAAPWALLCSAAPVNCAGEVEATAGEEVSAEDSVAEVVSAAVDAAELPADAADVASEEADDAAELASDAADVAAEEAAEVAEAAPPVADARAAESLASRDTLMGTPTALHCEDTTSRTAKKPYDQNVLQSELSGTCTYRSDLTGSGSLSSHMV